MKLLFYFKKNKGLGTSFDLVEREAIVDEQNGVVFGYKFEQIAFYGRRLRYIQKSAIGTIVYDNSGEMLVLEESDREKAKKIWSDYFDRKINEKKKELRNLISEQKMVGLSDAFFK